MFLRPALHWMAIAQERSYPQSPSCLGRGIIFKIISGSPPFPVLAAFNIS